MDCHMECTLALVLEREPSETADLIYGQVPAAVSLLAVWALLLASEAVLSRHDT
jgi:hypothetical protein